MAKSKPVRVIARVVTSQKDYVLGDSLPGHNAFTVGDISFHCGGLSGLTENGGTKHIENLGVDRACYRITAVHAQEPENEAMLVVVPYHAVVEVVYEMRELEIGEPEVEPTAAE